MFILVTNDDGYDAPGLWVAYDLANKIAGKRGRVAVIAPQSEQSGVGHAMSYLSPFRAERRREDHHLVEGTPTDCILVAQNLLDATPDLVISGVNKGHNLGPDLLYSGTVGAAIEATAKGIPAISLSQYYRPDRNTDECFDSARSHGIAAVAPLLKEFGENWPKGRFCNINFPACSSDDVAGICAVPAEPLSKSNVIARSQTAPNGRDYFWLGHPGPIQAVDPSADVAAVQANNVTVSFCHLNLSDDELTAQASQLFERIE